MPRRMTFIEEFFLGTDEVVYPKDLEKVGGSMAGERNGALLAIDVSERSIHLVRLRVEKKDAGLGVGSAALQWLCRLADKHCLAIKLHAIPTSHKLLDESQLLSWYKRYGFVRSGPYRLMVRKPR